MPHDLRVITYETIVAGARRHFLRSGSIDMDELASELAVSRATLYRAVDGRDRLLGDVLWSLAEHTYEQARRRSLARRRRHPRDLASLHRGRDHVTAVPSLPRAGATDRAARAPHARRWRPRARGRAAPELFAEAFAGHEEELIGDFDTSAYLYVRLRESILYADVVSGRQPDPEVAERAVRALLTSR